MSKPTQQEVNVYLDELKASGDRSMFNYPIKLQRKYRIKIDKAITMSCVWMDTFKERLKNGEVTK